MQGTTSESRECATFNPSNPTPKMKIHHNARLTSPSSRLKSHSDHGQLLEPFKAGSDARRNGQGEPWRIEGEIWIVERIAA